MTYEELEKALYSIPHLASWLSFDFDPNSYDKFDDYLSSMGYSTDVSWEEMKVDEAKALIRYCISTSLAYRTKLVLDNNLLDKITNGIIALFDSDKIKLLTNVLFDGNRVHSWDPITESTFEVAFVIFDDSNISLLIFEDED